MLVLSLLLPVLLITQSECQESEEDLYHMSPYMHIYPPTDTTLDQQSCSPDSVLNKTCPLYVALLMSFGGSYISSGVIPDVQVALDQINSDPTILPGYSLHYTLMDSQVSKCEYSWSGPKQQVGAYFTKTRYGLHVCSATQRGCSTDTQ